MTPAVIRALAEEELRAEELRQLIDTAKARLIARKTLKERIAALLPFTITWKKK